MQANERQVGGAHYGPGGAVQHWDLVWHYGLGYFPGQITKYVLRAPLKNGLQDLEKAAHFAQKYLELLNAARGSSHVSTLWLRDSGSRLRHFLGQQPINQHLPDLKSIFQALCQPHNDAIVREVGVAIERMQREWRATHADADSGPKAIGYVEQ